MRVLIFVFLITVAENYLPVSTAPEMAAGFLVAALILCFLQDLNEIGRKG